MTNLLANPGFEGQYQPWQGQTEVMVAGGWLPFWIPQNEADEAWRNRRPVYWAGLGARNPRFVRAGQTAQVYSSPWGTHIAGLMQTISVKPGQRLRFKAYGYAWSTDADTLGTSTNPGHVRMKVGIDPTGGTTPFASTVVWSVERAVYDHYDAGFTVEAIATHPSVTVFLLSAPEWPRKHNDVYWDDASMEVIYGETELVDEAVDDAAVLLLTRETQQVGAPVVARVKCPHLLNNVRLQVSGPSGIISPRQRGVSSTEREHVWRWEFDPVVEGPYTATVNSDEYDAITATILIGTGITTGGLVSQSIPHERGKPRTQYERTYILMPPGADREWQEAVLDSGVLLERGWTMGFNRDDAGIGDLDRRTVVVVNPSAWPEPIEAWFDRWYPGVNLRPVSVASPDALRVALSALPA